MSAPGPRKHFGRRKHTNGWQPRRNPDVDTTQGGMPWPPPRPDDDELPVLNGDNPLGFDFTLSCWHHDFGYRNYKAIGQFSANKARVDDTFYADMKRKCATYHSAVRPACTSLAWTYYQAVSIFGSVAAVQQADIDKARWLLP